MDNQLVLGIDIGGSHITAALVDVDSRTLISNSLHRKTVDSKAAAHYILDAWSETVRDCYKGYELLDKQIGIAMPGPFDYENGICLIKEQDKFKSLYQLNLKEELSSRLNIPTANIHFINDAAGFLQGEIFAGAAKGSSTILGLTLGTGMGSSISKNGIAVDAALWDFPFLDSIAENYLSIKWFVKRYHQLSGKELTGVKELANLLNEDGYAKQVFKEFGNNLAKFIMPLIKEHHAEIVILGGNIAQAFYAFSEDLMEVLNQNQLYTKIEITKLNEHAALIGAASLNRKS